MTFLDNPDGLASVARAQQFLTDVGFDSERTNDRSCLVLLALLGVKQGEPWAGSQADLYRTADLMEWIRREYGLDYKPNTRETVRRLTLHQFVDAGMVELNPDDTSRPTNSPKTCYGLSARALSLAQMFGTRDYRLALALYLADLPGLVAAYAHERALERIPVTLPDGSAIELSPGGQNPLIKSIVEEFCAIFAPGGRVLYVGDAGSKWEIFEADTLVGLGVEIESHGKMPDVVVHVPDRGWLLLIEAASSHGPVDAKRYGELKKLFAGSSAPLVYVSCFPSRAELRGYLAVISWETEVWCADNPEHLIHFNGDKFLGPYERG